MTSGVVTLAAPDRSDYLGLVIGHHTWATLSLIDRCVQLSAQQLELSTPGGYGSIGATLVHLVRADARYQRRILGESLGPSASGEIPVATLRSEMEHQAGRWRTIAERVREFDFTLPGEPDETPPYPEVEHAVGLVLVQAVHHGNEHRTHVCSILGAHDLDVPDLSGWEYVRAGQASA